MFMYSRKHQITDALDFNTYDLLTLTRMTYFTLTHMT